VWGWGGGWGWGCGGGGAGGGGGGGGPDAPPRPPQPGVGLGRPEHVADGDDVVVRAQGPEERDLSEGAPGVGGVVEGAGDLGEVEGRRVRWEGW